MSKLSIIFLAVLFLFSCKSSQKELQQGNYEQAFMKSVKKLQKKPDDREQAEIFALSYKKANQKNLDRIEYLKMSGEKKAYDEIYNNYRSLDRRQKLAETVLPLRAGGQTVSFQHINYNQQIISAKKSAADYHYRKGLELMRGDKASAKKAFYEFEAVKKYSSQYEDINRLQTEAKEKGTTTVLLVPMNKTYSQLSKEFLSNMIDFGMQDLDKDWIRYYNTPQKEYYDYNIFISISSVFISPDDMKESKETVNKQVKDGYKYILDAKGNVQKDSLGNDIKVDKYKTISCTVIQKTQNKTAKIQANVEYQDNKTKRIVATIPAIGEDKFHYVSAMANGDLNALNETTRKTIGKAPIAFPTGGEMIDHAGAGLKEQVKKILITNKRYIK
ncbi:MAG: hypothetical protein DRJ10_17770 [Bacteroidetes bacterium]|nr:MAG: hypothetical protein DRJ10_17770 [Bacteroidota bacterium]